MSALSQLATDMAAAAAAPLTQPPDDTSLDSDLHALTPAPQPSSSSSLPTRAASTQNHSNDDSHVHEAPPCSPCLSSTPPPFVAPDMLDTPIPTSLAVMPWREQQQCREQLIRSPGLYACWRMRRMVAMYSNSALSEFHEHLLAGRVTRFELVFAYVGLRREVSCLYTILGCGVAFREAPLLTPLVHFREDGQEVQMIDAAPVWTAMHRHFHLTFMPHLLVATVKSVRQA
jgi:hypothetical protein